MPKLLTKLPSYRRHSGRNKAFVVIAGKRTYLPGTYNSHESKAEYRRLCAEWVANARPAAPPPPVESITIAEVCVRFMRHASEHYRKNGQPTSEIHSLTLALKPLNELYGTTAAATFGPLRLKAVRELMVSRGLARPTINSLVSRIRRLFRWAASEEIAPAAIWQSLASVQGLQAGRTEAPEPPPVLPVDDATVNATLPHLPRVIRAMVELQRLCGARPAEVCIMRRGDIDTSGDVWRYVPSSHKTEHKGRERAIYLGPKAQAILAPFMERGAADYLFSPVESESERRQVLHASRKTPPSYGNAPGTNRKPHPRTEPGEHYEPAAYRRAVTRACEIAFQMPKRLRVIPKNAPDCDQRRQEAAQWRAKHCWHPNQLRHSAATRIREALGIESAQHTLGHAAPDMTLVYAERSAKVAQDAALKLG